VLTAAAARGALQGTASSRTQRTFGEMWQHRMQRQRRSRSRGKRLSRGLCPLPCLLGSGQGHACGPSSGDHAWHAADCKTCRGWLCPRALIACCRKIVNEVMRLKAAGEPIPEHLLPPVKAEKAKKGDKEGKKGKKK